MEYWINDIKLASSGKKQIDQTLRDMPGIQELRKRYMDEKPLRGIKITGCVWVTYETASFILLLRDLGADLRWCSDNKYASMDDACAYLVSEGIPIFAKRGMTDEEYTNCFDKAWRFKDEQGNDIGPDYIIDDGCDITRYLHDNYPKIIEKVSGLVEQTTCGATDLKKLANSGNLLCPAININDSVTKSKFDNIYGSRESLIDGFQNALNMQVAGKRCIVFGYGEVGKGCVQTMKGLGANVGICEIDPILAMQAHMEGVEVYDKESACKKGDIFITATGCIKTIDGEDLKMMKKGAVLMNMGHGDMEINTQYLKAGDYEIEEVNPLLHRFFNDNEELLLLSSGNLVNISGIAGHPPRVMSITFTNHLVALLDLINNPKKYNENKVYYLDIAQEEEVARINFPEIADNLIQLTDEQAQYLGVSKDGPLKNDRYRY